MHGTISRGFIALLVAVLAGGCSADLAEDRAGAEEDVAEAPVALGSVAGTGKGDQLGTRTLLWSLLEDVVVNGRHFG
ncbi:MAG: hypothetical protein AAGA56_05145, partial [Myxococcota bacterium]